MSKNLALLEMDDLEDAFKLVDFYSTVPANIRCVCVCACVRACVRMYVCMCTCRYVWMQACVCNGVIFVIYFCRGHKVYLQFSNHKELKRVSVVLIHMSLLKYTERIL